MRKKLLPLVAGPRGAGMQNTTEINHVLPTCVPGGHGFYTLPDLTVAIQYVVLGVTMDGRKDILGAWIGEHENSKFWLNVLNDLKSRGVLDVYLFCTDGLCGMMQAIEAVFPKSRLQRCIVHQVRSSTRYVSYKDVSAS